MPVGHIHLPGIYQCPVPHIYHGLRKVHYPVSCSCKYLPYLHKKTEHLGHCCFSGLCALFSYPVLVDSVGCCLFCELNHNQFSLKKKVIMKASDMTDKKHIQTKTRTVSYFLRLGFVLFHVLLFYCFIVTCFCFIQDFQEKFIKYVLLMEPGKQKRIPALSGRISPNVKTQAFSKIR